MSNLDDGSPSINPFTADEFRSLRMDVDEKHGLAQAIVDTIREPLLVLDHDLRVVTANRAFSLTFGMDRRDIVRRPVYALAGGQWDVPALRSLLESIVPRSTVMDGYEIEIDFPGIGRRILLLNARKVYYEDGLHTTILLALEDITERRVKERELTELLHHKDVLLREMQHRVGNSLQIIASILLIKARTVQSLETRAHLEDAYQRILSVAAVQQQLEITEPDALVPLGPYLTSLCETLSASMIGDGRSASTQVRAENGTATAKEAVSLGLIVTELFINAVKYAFPDGRMDGVVTVSYEVADRNWRLTVSDNGIGRPDGQADKCTPGLGTTIVEALAKQLDARVETTMDHNGTTVSVTHATFSPKPAGVETGVNPQAD